MYKFVTNITCLFSIRLVNERESKKINNALLNIIFSGLVVKPKK